MRIRAIGALLLAGVVCIGTTVAEESPSSLLSKGRQAFKRGNYSDAERYDRLAVDAAEHSGDTDQFAEALGDLGGTLLAEGQYAEAKRFSLKALSILQSKQMKRYLPVVLNNLSQLSRQDGDNVQSERYLNESFRVAEEVDPHDPFIARILNNMGVVYYTTGDTGRAEKTFRKGIAFIEKELGRDREELAPLLNNLGGVYVARKKWDAAAPLFYRALSLLEHSGNFQDAASILDSLGGMYYARENVPEAEKAFRRAYELRLKVFGAKHPVVARTALNLAAALAAESRYGEAEDLYANALQVYEERLGPRAREVASTLDQMAKMLRKTNKGMAAGELEIRAESIRFELDHVLRVGQPH